MFRESPLHSLKAGHWVKLIGGASFQDLPTLRHLAIAYGLAGVDCLDLAADEAVVTAVREGLQVAENLSEEAKTLGFLGVQTPWIMVSLNDGEDPHFRKADFNIQECARDCPRPCEKICPAQAILFNNTKDEFSGVIREKCYGCGRCLPICPYGIIYTNSSVSTPEVIAPLIMSTGIDAIEIHTQIGRLAEFQRLWQAIAPWVDQLKLLAISCNDGEGLIDYLQTIYDLIIPRPQFLIWQTDGRSMSGDIGNGTTIATIKLGQKVLAANLPGYVQLAGGTNSYTVTKLKAMGLLNDFGLENNTQNPKSKIAGVAYGSYARVLLSPMLDQLENKEVINTDSQGNIRLEEKPELLWQAVELAHGLVSQIKSQ